MNKTKRPLDVIVWGATGFTGKLAAEYLAARVGVGKDVTWALGGRSKAKLEEVRRHLETIDPAAKNLPIVVGDARDAASLAKLVEGTRVVLTTVGPYALHGRELVAACANAGTDYCDLAGETPFIRDVIDEHDARARETGARIVHCCGFDSIPSDLGTFMLQEYAREQLHTRATKVSFFVVKMKGGFSGGTIASMFNVLESAKKSPHVRKIAGDPYGLCPGERGPDGRDQTGPRFDKDLGKWTAPFVMAAINTRVVRRTNTLLDHAWGRDFRYSEAMSTGRGAAGYARALALSAGFGAFAGLAMLSPTRALMEKTVLPAPGEGPSKAERDHGFFEIELWGTLEGRSAASLVARVAGTSDPGYGATAKMIGESALCLAKDDVADHGGVLTPAYCMGHALIQRLRAAGMTFEVSERG